MTWTRLDDTWTDLPELADLPHADRWHYLCMIQFCSRTLRYDGVLKVADARRSSDVDDPEESITNLTAVGLVERQADGRLRLTRIDQHIPPPSVRENSEKSKIRMQRMRAHKNGDHSMCLPGKCKQIAVNEETGEVTPTPVTGDVTRNTGTGQDGTGRALEGDVTTDEAVTRNRSTSSSPEPCFSCGKRPATVGTVCAECSGLQHQSVSEASAPDVPTAHRAPSVPRRCAYSGCGSPPREGKQMCGLHFTYEPSRPAA